MSISSKATGLRKCPDCKTDQPLSNYTIRKDGKVAAYCKPCNAKRTAAYRADNREKHLESKRAHRRRWKEQHSTIAIRQNWDNLSIEERDKVGCGIYCITINEKFYIGSCVHFGHRMKEHTRKLRNGRHVNKFMQGVFDKHQMFEAELIETCAPCDLERLEQQYIDQWFDDERCMNLRPHARTMLGFRHSEATKRKLSEIVRAFNKERSNVGV